LKLTRSEGELIFHDVVATTHSSANKPDLTGYIVDQEGRHAPVARRIIVAPVKGAIGGVQSYQGVKPTIAATTRVTQQDHCAGRNHTELSGDIKSLDGAFPLHQWLGSFKRNYAYTAPALYGVTACNEDVRGRWVNRRVGRGIQG
jgi:hypothetical protein